jgi:SAM-dependent methyltransferase
MMNDQPQTWHYGLVARHWAERNTSGPEIAYFQRQIEQNGQPALDAGCGTGRLLIPFLRAGLDVDGCDVSADMLALCREKAEREGLKPQLYQQALHELDLPRTYQTIVVCGTLGIGGSRQQDAMVLQRLYHHLKPGGRLVLDHHLPYESAKEWQLWLKEGRERLPEAWPERMGKTPPVNGSDYQLYGRVVAFDPLEQQLIRQMHTLLWRDGQVVAEEEYTLIENLYFRNELGLMLEQAGFAVEAVRGGYSEAEATADDVIIVFIARK